MSRRWRGRLKRLAVAATYVVFMCGLAAPGMPVAGAASSTFYVSTTGSDSNAGTQSQPFATINHAVSQAVYSPGATIYVEQGTYTLTAPVAITTNLTLTSDASTSGSAANTIIDATNQENGIVIEGAGADGASVANLTVENAQKAGIVALSTSNVTIQGNVVQNNDQSCAGYTNCNNPNSNNGIPSGDPGSNVPSGGTAFSATNSIPCGNLNTGGSDCESIHLIGVTNSQVMSNTVQNNLDGGIYLTDETGPTTGNSIGGNTIENNQVDCGITLASHTGQGVSNNTVADNTSEGNGAAGVVLATSAGSVTNNTVQGNTIENNAQGGVVLHTHSATADVSGNTVAQNTISGNGPDPDSGATAGEGISIAAAGPPGTADVQNTTITGNIISGEAFGAVLNGASGTSVPTSGAGANTITSTAVPVATFPLTFNGAVTVSPSNVTVGGTATVSGTVYDGTGNPMAGATVDLSDGSVGGSFSASTTTTDANGAFTSTYTAPTTPQTVTVTASVYGTHVSDTAMLTVLPQGVLVNGTSQGSASAGGGGTSTPETSAAGTGGAGTITVEDYSGDPGPAPTFSAAGIYFDVSLSPANTYTQVTITQCGVSANDGLYWLDGGVWQAVSPAPTYNGSTGCLSFVATSSSSPNLTQLTGTPFAVAGTALSGAVGGGGGAVGGGGGGPTSGYVSFSDVPSSYWAAVYIERLVQANVINGFPDHTFRPDESVTRAQFTKMLVLTLHLSLAASGQTSFTDVPATAWYAPYVATAVTDGIVQGVSSTTFDPNGNVTREQMAVMLARALHLSGTTTLAFTDAASIDSWATSGVEEVTAAGYINGFPNHTFQPLADATRAQAAKVLDLVLSKGS